MADNKSDAQIQKIVDDKTNEVLAEVAPISAFIECKRRIVKVMKEAMAEYYKRYPPRIEDQRGLDAQDWSFRGLKDIFNVLDDYEINYKPKE